MLDLVPEYDLSVVRLIANSAAEAINPDYKDEISKESKVSFMSFD